MEKRIEELERNKRQVIISTSVSIIIGLILIILTISNLANIKSGIFFILLPFGFIGLILLLYGLAIIFREMKLRIK